MKSLFLNPVNGIAGDMVVGALLDLGADTPEFWRQLRSLPLPAAEWQTSAAKVTRHGVAATQYSVGWVPPPHQHHGRRLPDIQRLIEQSDLAPAAKRRAVAVFGLLADAEAAVHHVAPADVHFHEVGAVDAIADICGACLGLELLGVERVLSTPPALGGGTVTCAHGTLPVPVPAVTRLLQGLPVRLGPGEQELTTPTGAALLKAFTDEFVDSAAGVVLATGYGAGTRELADRANVLPATLLETGAADVDVIECNLDDLAGQVLSFLGPRLFAAGALDVTVIPCQMKKNRPGIVLQVLTGRADREALIRLLLRETTTFGVRWQAWHRVVLRRHSLAVETPAGRVSVKLGFDPATGELLQVAPEYEDCARAAAASGLPLLRVHELARQAARDQAGSGSGGRGD